MRHALTLLFSLSILSTIQAQENTIDKFVTSSFSSPKAGEYYLLDQTQITTEFKVFRREFNGKVVAQFMGNTPGKSTVFEGLKSLDSRWKLSPGLQNQEKKKLKKIKNWSLKVTDFDEFVKEAGSIEDVLIEHFLPETQIVIVTYPGDKLERLISFSTVTFIDQLHREPVEESLLRQHDFGLNRINLFHDQYPSIVGDELTISIKENAFDVFDLDLVGRAIVDDQSSSINTDHATDMATLVAGSGNSFKTGLGVIPHARVLSTSFASLFPESIEYYEGRQISVQNHSYGIGIENFYGNEAVSYDQSALDQPELLHVFSSGNSGNQTPADGIYQGLQGYATLTGTFKQSKNTLAIAALDSFEVVQSLNSIGPAYDGRIKPELVAFGGEGSSEAAAMISGAAGAIQSHYNQLHGTLPANALVKAILIAGADEAAGHGIDYETGYGSLNLSRSAMILSGNQFASSTITSHNNEAIQIDIPDNTSEIKVVLVWNDPPANPGDAVALVHNLDLSVRSFDDEVYLPWVLSSAPHVDSLKKEPRRAIDHINNVEMVTIANPASGNYTIQVNASELTANQEFHIAYVIKEKDILSWAFPTKSDHLEANKSYILRWDNTFETGSGEIQIKYGDEQWEPLGSVVLDEGQLRFITKDTTSIAQLKMIVSGQEFLSDQFTVNPIPDLDVAINCASEFSLVWNDMENVSSYELYQLSENSKLLLTTSDTIVDLDKLDHPQIHYALRPLFADAQPGLRSPALNYLFQSKGCYIDNFQVSLNVDKEAEISLRLNKSYEIVNVTLYKVIANDTLNYQSFQPGFTETIIFTDDELQPGWTGYFAQLELASGEIILSEYLGVLFTNPETVITFPNPVINEANIFFLNDLVGGTLEIITDKGQLVESYVLLEELEPINVEKLEKGLYLYRIHYMGNYVTTGKIVIL